MINKKIRKQLYGICHVAVGLVLVAGIVSMILAIASNKPFPSWSNFALLIGLVGSLLINTITESIETNFFAGES